MDEYSAMKVAGLLQVYSLQYKHCGVSGVPLHIQWPSL